MLFKCFLPTVKYHYSYCFLTYLIKWNMYDYLAIITGIIYFIYICLMVLDYCASFLIKVLRECYIIANKYFL